MAKVMTTTTTTATSPAKSSATVLEFICLFTHDLRRKQKRWQDGRLKYHLFNKRIMVYDDRGNSMGDTYWREDYEFGEGEEVQLERGGVIVQASECVGRQDQDLSELIDKRAQERLQRQTAAADTHQARPRLGPAGPVRPLLQTIGRPQAGAHGRAKLPTESPFEERQRLGALQNGADGGGDTHDTPSRPAKRRRRDPSPPSKNGYAQNLFGATLTLSATPVVATPVRRQPAKADHVQPDAEDSSLPARPRAVERTPRLPQRSSSPPRDHEPLMEKPRSANTALPRDSRLKVNNRRLLQHVQPSREVPRTVAREIAQNALGEEDDGAELDIVRSVHRQTSQSPRSHAPLTEKTSNANKTPPGDARLKVNRRLLQHIQPSRDIPRAPTHKARQDVISEDNDIELEPGSEPVKSRPKAPKSRPRHERPPLAASKRKASEEDLQTVDVTKKRRPPEKKNYHKTDADSRPDPIGKKQKGNAQDANVSIDLVSDDESQKQAKQPKRTKSSALRALREERRLAKDSKTVAATSDHVPHRVSAPRSKLGKAKDSRNPDISRDDVGWENEPHIEFRVKMRKKRGLLMLSDRHQGKHSHDPLPTSARSPHGKVDAHSDPNPLPDHCVNSVNNRRSPTRERRGHVSATHLRCDTSTIHDASAAAASEVAYQEAPQLGSGESHRSDTGEEGADSSSDKPGDRRPPARRLRGNASAATLHNGVSRVASSEAVLSGPDNSAIVLSDHEYPRIGENQQEVPLQPAPIIKKQHAGPLRLAKLPRTSVKSKEILGEISFNDESLGLSNFCMEATHGAQSVEGLSARYRHDVCGSPLANPTPYAPVVVESRTAKLAGKNAGNQPAFHHTHRAALDFSHGSRAQRSVSPAVDNRPTTPPRRLKSSASAAATLAERGRSPERNAIVPESPPNRTVTTVPLLQPPKDSREKNAQNEGKQDLMQVGSGGDRGKQKGTHFLGEASRASENRPQPHLKQIIQNPATRGRKACVPGDAAGKVPQPVLPAVTTDIAVDQVPSRRCGGASAHGDEKDLGSATKPMEAGFSRAGGGPWSVESYDLFEFTRPAR